MQIPNTFHELLNIYLTITIFINLVYDLVYLRFNLHAYFTFQH